MSPFWWACWTAWQTWAKKLQALWNAELVLVAVLGDGDALHQFHHEVGPAGVGRAGIEDLGDVGMVHHRQRLPLGLEAGDDLPRVHAELDDLERHPAADRLFLLGHEHDAEAAFADLFQQLVAADLRAGAFAEADEGDGGLVGFVGELEEAAGRIVGGEQGLDAFAQCGIAAAGLVEIRGPSRRRRRSPPLRERFPRFELDQLAYTGPWHSQCHANSAW